MRAWIWATSGVLAAVCAVAPGQAAAQAAAPYPFSQDAAEIARWLRAETDAPQSGLVGVGDGRAFVLAPGASASGESGATEATLQVEALTPRAAALMHGRSMRIAARVRCGDRQVELATTATYAATRQSGSPSEERRGPGFAAAPPGSMLDRVVDKICGLSAAAAVSPTPPPELAAEPITNPPEPATAQAEPSSPEAVAAPVARPAGRPVKGGGASVQIGAFPSPADAQSEWGKDRSLASSEGLRLRTESVKSGGRTLYRGIVEGFASHAAAEQFCASLKIAGRACLVRR